MKISHVDKLCHNPVALTAAYRAGLPLQERDWVRYPPACWDKPAFIAMDSETCLGAIQYRYDDDDRHYTVDFAFATAPSALMPLASAFRAKAKGSEVHFTCHPGNAEIMRLVRILRLQPHSMSYRLVL